VYRYENSASTSAYRYIQCVCREKADVICPAVHSRRFVVDLLFCSLRMHVSAIYAAIARSV
jgi:hypothetical protein